ncbi:hypothetical protein OIV83_001683 [Microbotryomycetes sp. JL201]|nr:hypothetical protein OIV83_001683 [Microbotryomycetes sp. JL201]
MSMPSTYARDKADVQHQGAMPIVSVVIARPFVLVVTIVWSSLAWTISFVFSVLGLPAVPLRKQTRQRPRRRPSITTQSRSFNVSEGLRRLQPVAQLGLGTSAAALGPPRQSPPTQSPTWSSLHLKRVKRVFDRTAYIRHELEEVEESDEPTSASSAETGFGHDHADMPHTDEDEDESHGYSSVPDLAQGHESDSDLSEVQTLNDYDPMPSGVYSSAKAPRKSAVLRALGLRKSSVESHAISTTQSTATSTRQELPSPTSPAASAKSSSNKFCKTLCRSRSRREDRQPKLNRSDSDSSVPRRHSVPPCPDRLSRSLTTPDASLGTKRRSKSIIKRSLRSLSPLSRSPVASPLPSPPLSPKLCATKTHL